jgi:sec-independent protein translocase protein TatB
MGEVVAFSAPGMWEMVFLAVLALLIFGPDRLPGMARSLGRTISAFKREATSTLDELKRSADLDDIRDVADELRSTGSELRRSAALTGGSAVAASRRRAESDPHEPAGTDGPPPFDPDAT